MTDLSKPRSRPHTLQNSFKVTNHTLNQTHQEPINPIGHHTKTKTPYLAHLHLSLGIPSCIITPLPQPSVAWIFTQFVLARLLTKGRELRENPSCGREIPPIWEVRAQSSMSIPGCRRETMMHNPAAKGGRMFDIFSLRIAGDLHAVSGWSVGWLDGDLNAGRIQNTRFLKRKIEPLQLCSCVYV